MVLILKKYKQTYVIIRAPLKWWYQHLSQLSVVSQVCLHVVATVNHSKDMWIRRRSGRACVHSLVLLTEKVPRRTRTSTVLLLSLFTLSVLLQPEFSTKPMMQDLLWSVPLTWSTWIKYKDLKEHDPDFPLLQRRDALVPFYFRSISCSSKSQIRHEVLSADGKWQKNKVAWKHA